MLAAGAFSPSAAAAEGWPGLRGPTHDGAVRETRLFDGPAGGLTVAWQRPLGSGYSVAVADGRRVVTAFQSGPDDLVAAFDPANGKELWRYRIADAHAGHTGSHNGPIATPVLDGDRVYGLGPRGHLFALDATDGSPLWTKHLVDDLGAEPPYYGFATSPLVADGVLVVALGAGEGRTVGGFDPRSGELRWSTGSDTVRYQSPILATLGGRRQVVAAGNWFVAGIDPASGAELWSYEHAGDERDMGGNTIVPVPAGEDRILLLNTHPESVMLQVRREEEGWAVRELWKGGSIKASYVQPVYHDGYLYGMNSKIFTCVDAATGETVWRSREPGDGFPTLIGDHLAIMAKAGVLRVAEASPSGYREVARLDLFDGVSWTAPAWAGGSLFVRSMGSLARVDPVAGGRAEGGETASSGGGSGFARFLARVEAAADKAATIHAYLAESPPPIVESSGAVHFLYRGPADDVGIVGDMIGFRREDPMTRIAGTDLFYYSTRLEPDASVHYGFLVDYGDPVADPLNPQTGGSLFGELSWLAMPGRRKPRYLGEAPAPRRGRVEEIEWQSAAPPALAGGGEAPPSDAPQTHRAKVYLPAGYDDSDRRYPVVYVHRGEDALDEGAMQTALDNLIGHSVAPLVAVFLLSDESDPWRGAEPRFVAEAVATGLVPLIDRRYRTLADPLSRAAVGTARGGDLALATAFARPDLFARAGALSPVLFGAIGEPPEAAERPLVLYLAWGTYHLRSPHENFDAAVEARALWRELRERGHRPAGGERPEGFGWACWKAYTGEMLRALFPLG